MDDSKSSSTHHGIPIVKEVTINASVDKVWQAITDREEIKNWFIDPGNFAAEPGFEFQFEGGRDGRTYLHFCKIIEVIPLKKLSYSWRYDGYPGDSLVTYELFSEEGRTKVKLTHEGLETFGNDNPDFAKENFIEGWNHIIGTSLKNTVMGNH